MVRRGQYDEPAGAPLLPPLVIEETVVEERVQVRQPVNHVVDSSSGLLVALLVGLGLIALFVAMWWGFVRDDSTPPQTNITNNQNPGEQPVIQQPAPAPPPAVIYQPPPQPASTTTVTATPAPTSS